MNSDEKLAYVAGWFASDGHLTSDPTPVLVFSLKGSDIYILELFASWFGGNAKVYTSKRTMSYSEVDYEMARWRCTNKELIAYINLHDPKNFIIRENLKLQKLFIQGFFEGDGCVAIRPNGSFRLTLANGAQSLLNDIQKHFLKVLDIEIKKLKPRGRPSIILADRDTCQIDYESRTARIIAWYLYKEAEYFLPRKAVIVNKLFKAKTDPVDIYLNILLTKATEYILHDGGFMFRLFGSKDSLNASKNACAGFKLLGINATPITYGKGKHKYYGVYIPQSHIHILVYTQDILKKRNSNSFAGKVFIKDESIVRP
jgi:hypothetical protein